MDNQSPIIAYLVTLGCAKNLVDAEVMCGTMAANGIYLTTDQEDADITIVNTCSFIKDARKEAEDSIKQALKWRSRGLRRGILRAVAVAGCLPQRNPSACAQAYPDVDFFIGLDDIPQVHTLIKHFFSSPGNGSRHIPEARLPEYLYDHTSPRITVTPESYSFIKIAEGCDHRCAFCAIPGIRGHLRSRQPESVLEECKMLLDGGCHEIDLIAQDSSAYGLDFSSSAKASLAGLLEEIEKLQGDFWVRVLYTHPCHVNDRLLDLLAHGTHTVPYLDMPLQHINDSVLTAMKRRMGGAETRKLVEHIRTDYPQLCFRTTLLTGFPGETDEAYAELKDFVSDVRFDRMGVFSFSPEEGTPAAEITDGLVAANIGSRRRNELLAIQRKISRELNSLQVGKTLRVLIDEQPTAKSALGRSSFDAPEVDQHIVIKTSSNRKGANRFADVKITGFSDYELTGMEA